MAEALKANGVSSAMVVNGHDGMDEITTTELTIAAQLIKGKISEFEITPEAYGINSANLSDLAGGEPAVNAAALSALLEGQHSAYRDIVLLNAGAALTVAGKASDIKDGIALATESLDSGKAKSILTKLAEFSHG
jgi:anthranilate phosphoribosyltransferase